MSYNFSKKTHIYGYNTNEKMPENLADRIDFINEHLKHWHLNGFWSQEAINKFIAKRNLVNARWEHKKYSFKI